MVQRSKSVRPFVHLMASKSKLDGRHIKNEQEELKTGGKGEVGGRKPVKRSSQGKTPIEVSVCLSVGLAARTMAFKKASLCQFTNRKVQISLFQLCKMLLKATVFLFE